MASPVFGYESLDDNGNPLQGEITEVLEKSGQLDSYTAELLLREAYDIDFRINDHRLPINQGPMNLVKMNAKENPSSYSRLYETIRRYRTYRIHQYFGYTLTQFLELPREFVDYLFTIASEEVAADTRSRTSAMHALEDGIKDT